MTLVFHFHTATDRLSVCPFNPLIHQCLILKSPCDRRYLSHFLLAQAVEEFIPLKPKEEQHNTTVSYVSTERIIILQHNNYD